jgi:hypothetical protein
VDEANSFVSRHAQGDILLIRGCDATGGDAWYILRCLPGKAVLVTRLCSEAKPFNVTDYGTVLESGYGKNPPASILKEYFTTNKA